MVSPRSRCCPLRWRRPWDIGTVGAREIMLLIVLGLCCTALAHTLFIGGLAVVTAHTASVIAALEPVYGIVLALAFLGEVPGARTIAGGVLIVAAAVIATRRSHLGTVPSRSPIG